MEREHPRWTEFGTWDAQATRVDIEVVDAEPDQFAPPQARAGRQCEQSGMGERPQW